MKSLGKNNEKSCFPVYAGPSLVLVPGFGSSPEYPPNMARFENSWTVNTVSSFVRRYAPVTKSLNAPIIGPPYLGEINWSWTLIRRIASALASSLCGTCRFISSPSKSALYGGQTDGCNLNVLPGRTLT